MRGCGSLSSSTLHPTPPYHRATVDAIGHAADALRLSVDPAWQHVASTGGMVVSAADETGEVRAVERDDHPFFLATLYQPQLRSSRAAPHPVWLGLLQAASERAAQ